MVSSFARCTIIAFLLMSLLLSGCVPVALGPNEIQGLQQGTTLLVLDKASSFLPLSFIMAKGDFTLFAAYIKDVEAWGFVAVNSTKLTFENAKTFVFPNGNVTEWTTLKQLIDGLKQYGWDKVTSADQLPSGLLVALDIALTKTSTAVGSALSWASTSLPTLLVIPIIEMPRDDFMRSIIDPGNMFEYSEE